MKRCLFTLMSNNFLIGYEAFMKSFLYHNTWFKDDMVVLDNRLSDRTKERMKEIYNNITFRKPNYAEYEKVKFEKTVQALQSTYYKLDAFSLYEYDRVIQLDMDMICQGDMLEVFECDRDIAACQTYRAPGDCMGHDINSGVFVVNKKYLNSETYEALLKKAISGHAMPDQKVINQYFKEVMFHLPKKYNVEKRMLHSKTINLPVKDWVIIHYVGKKPWHDFEDLPKAEQRYSELVEIWEKWNGC